MTPFSVRYSYISGNENGFIWVTVKRVGSLEPKFAFLHPKIRIRNPICFHKLDFSKKKFGWVQQECDTQNAFRMEIL